MAFCQRPALALNVQLFRPAPDFTGGVVAPGTYTLAPGMIETGVFLNWVTNPLEFGLPTNNVRLDDIVNNVVTLDFQAAYGLLDNVTIAAGLPFHPLNDLEPLNAATETQDVSIGDLMLQGHIRLLHHDNKKLPGLGFGVMPFFTLPTGAASRFVGESNVTGGLKLLTDYLLSSRDHFRFNIGLRFRETEQIAANLRVNHEVLAALGYTRVIWEKQSLSAFAEVYGSTTMRSFLNDEVASPFEGDIGLHKRWPKQRLSAVAGIGRGFDNGYGAPDFRFFSGLTYKFGPFPKHKPAVGSVQIVVKNDDGTPHPAKIEIFDAASETPLQAQADVDQLAAQMNPNKYNLTVTAEGYYPKKGRFLVDKNKTTYIEIVLRKQFTGRIETVGKVLFDLNKASIKEESFPVLANIVEILERYPEITKIRVEAHTDSLSSDAYNLQLSDKRANSVMNHLIDKGIAKERLTFTGFGESKPIAPNNTREGRAKNRRVEFVILDIVPPNVEIEDFFPSELYNIEKDKPQSQPNPESPQQ